jgi:6-pyruvoyltetrahydropterin/6-carboxytetrahydropterin synthase
MKLFKRFTFEGSHSLPEYPQVHGHSYHVEICVEGNPWDVYVMRESKINQICYKLKQLLDHKYLNDFIDIPTSENIAKFIWNELKDFPIFEVKVERPSIGLGVIYQGPTK